MKTRVAVASLGIAGLLAPGGALAADSGSFGPAGTMGTARDGPTAAALADGRILVAGGAPGLLSPVASAELYNQATGLFAPTGSMAIARSFAGSARLPDGKVLVAGGGDGGLSATSSAELYDPAAGTFSTTDSMDTARSAPAVAPLPGGRVLVAGGFAGGLGGMYLATAEVYDPATNVFSTLPNSMTTPRSGAVAAPLPDGKVLIAGGFDGTSYLSSAEIFDPATNTFSSSGIGSMGSIRSVAAAAPMWDGRVLVAGGYNGAGNVNTAEAFDSATKTFSSVGISSMAAIRGGPGAAPLADGRVLVVGGDQAIDAALKTGEIFAAVNSFSFRAKGKTVFVSVEAVGTVSVAPASSHRGATTAKKKRRRASLKLSSAAGGPGTVAVKLKLTKRAAKRLRDKGRLRVRATITFDPRGGLPRSEAAFLKLTSKKRNKKQ